MHHAIPKDCLFTGLIPAGRSSRAAKASLKKATPLGGSASLMALCRPRALKNFEPIAHSSRHQRIPSPAQGRFRGLIFDGGAFLVLGCLGGALAGCWPSLPPASPASGGIQGRPVQLEEVVGDRHEVQLPERFFGSP